MKICIIIMQRLSDPRERQFLEAAERGDMATMVRLASEPEPVNVNCTDMLGRSALLIAVDNENAEIVEMLLKYEAVITGNALMHAIAEGSYKIVELIVQHPSIQSDMLSSPLPPSERSDAPPGVSPIMMAAQCNQFEILQLFLSYGAFIRRPHASDCGCRPCTEEIQEDRLRRSLCRIQTYRALSGPAWISLTSEDPILEAFRLSWELTELSRRENEFHQTYQQLSDQCKRYACDLLEQCRSSEEVLAVLDRRTPGEDLVAGEDGEEVEDADWPAAEDDRPAALSRLRLAIRYEQKQFVAHSHSQQMLMSVWYTGLPLWRGRNPLLKVLICAVIVLLIPLLSVLYLLFPRSRVGRAIRSPFMKFIYHSASFCFFLLLLVLASMRPEGDERSHENIRGPKPSPVEWLIIFWVAGMVWAECKQLWDEGLSGYVRQWWNWLDFVMLSIYICSFSLRAVAYFQIRSGSYGCRSMDRLLWPINDPTLIAEGLFAVASVFSFARIIYLFQTNPHLGPLQISLGCMIIDIIKFLFIFFLILTSFACGLNQLYWYYRHTPGNNSGGELFRTALQNVSTESCGLNQLYWYYRHTPGNNSGGELFRTIGTSYTTLLWSLFGQIPVQALDQRRHQTVTHLLGQTLLGAYLIMAVTVMVNMLIAMMSRSFQIVEDHADREWKFARSQLWMSYFEQGSSLPPPFNMVVSPKWVWYAVRWVLSTARQCTGAVRARLRPADNGTAHQHHHQHQQRHQHQQEQEQKTGVNGGVRFLLRAGSRDSEADRAEDSCGAGGAGRQPRVSATTSVSTAEVAFECQVPYSEVMRRLVSRYIFHFKNQHRHSGANEDDFMEIKQDISSLRYELREDRKREASRNYRNLDNLRRDIVTLFREELGGGLNVPPDGRAYSSDCGPDTIYRKPSRRGRTSLTAHSQQLSLDLGLLGRPEGGGGAAEPAPLRSPDVSVTTLASLRQLVRREVELLPQVTPERTPAGSPGSAAETSPEARSLQQLSEHICQWQEATGVDGQQAASVDLDGRS
ncbi:transient-receptor-potential-like protein [Amphibalanus amphitrite]|uniref:transient-receptor-potential-like protein n=1 Tax=Amphibalanus amphitrite TaxID=1232801 RepID=UPI001C915844|nr:transient-receptor-potential-like protein [Amphibalanus amphitrite]